MTCDLAPLYCPMAQPYQFSVHIGTACAKQMRTFADLAEKLKMDVTDLMRQCNAKAPLRGPWSRVWP
jgi:hypothetical protein